MQINKIYQGDALTTLKTFPDNSINCIVTSPPYWSLRNYQHENQIGLEPTIEQYIQNLTLIFQECKRTLTNDGTCFIVIGDTYCSSGGASRHKGYHDPKYKKGRNIDFDEPSDFKQSVKPKSLCGIPFRLAITLINQGWLLRNTIIWHKKNAMPSSAKDRFTVDFEYILFLTKSKKYNFNQQYEPLSKATLNDKRIQFVKKYGKLQNTKQMKKGYEKHLAQDPVYVRNSIFKSINPLGRNKRTTWTINTKPFMKAHFATFPPKLVETCIKAGSNKNQTILDPFMGSGTTAYIAKQLDRNYIGIEINPEYINIAKERLNEN